MPDAVNRISNVGPEGVQAAAQGANRFQADTNSLREQSTAAMGQASETQRAQMQMGNQQLMQGREIAAQQGMQQRQLQTQRELAEMEQLFHTKLAGLETERGVLLEQYKNARLTNAIDIYKGMGPRLMELEAQKQALTRKGMNLKVLGQFMNNPEGLHKDLFDSVEQAKQADLAISKHLGEVGKAQIFQQLSNQIRKGKGQTPLGLNHEAISQSLLDGLVNGAEPGKLDVEKARLGLSSLIRGLGTHSQGDVEQGLISLGESGVSMRHVHNAVAALSDMSHGDQSAFQQALLQSMGQWDAQKGSPLDPAMADWAHEVIGKGMGAFNDAFSYYKAAAHGLKQSGRLQSTGEDPDFAAFSAEDVPRIIAMAAHGRIKDPEMQDRLARLPADMRKAVTVALSKHNMALSGKAASLGLGEEDINSDPITRANEMETQGMAGLLSQESGLSGEFGGDVARDDARLLEGLRDKIRQQYTNTDEFMQDRWKNGGRSF